MIYTKSISTMAARLSFTTATLCLLLLAALHVLKPELDPSWHMVSEYAIGRFGWVMMLSFLSMSVSCAALFVAIRTQVQTRGGKIGLGLLLIVAVALTAAAFNAMDPITATKNQLTMHGNMHGFASMIGVPGLPIAAIMITLSLVRNPAWSSQRRMLLWAANLTWVSLVLMVVTIGITLPQHGGFGPGVPVGWPNRLILFAYNGWVMIVAWRAFQLRSQK